jgi:hypothetical protein
MQPEHSSLNRRVWWELLKMYDIPLPYRSLLRLSEQGNLVVRILQGPILIRQPPHKCFLTNLLDRGLFHGAPSEIDCIALNGRMTDESERIWKEAVIA